MPNPILALRVLIAFGKIVRDPNQLDVVFDLVDGFTKDPKSAADFAVSLADPAVAEAAARRIRLPELDLNALATLPSGSLGEVAGRFFRAHGLDPAALPRREAADDVEWLSAHLYESHDLWHVVTGFGPDVAGELGLQAFYAAQLEGPVALAIITAGLLNTLIYAPAQRRARLAAIARGWRMGAQAKGIVGADWGRLLFRPLAEIRDQLGLTVEPDHDAMRELPPAAISGELRQAA